MGMYYCPNCNADLEDQFGFDPSNGTWTCTECGQLLMDDDIADGDTYDGVAWFCDNCNALLNRQSGFSDSYGTWTCTECGHTNSISDEDIIEDEHKCPNCGANLKKQWNYSKYTNDYTCSECGSVLHRDYSGNEFSVIADEDKCPNCGAYLKSQWGFSTYDDDWTCTECNAELHREYSSDPFSTVEDEHKCPNCGTSLLKQAGYSEYCYNWTCSKCNSELHRDYMGIEFSVVEKDDSENSYDDDDTNQIYYQKATTPSSTNIYNSQATTINNTYTRTTQKKDGTSWRSIFLIAIVISIIVSVYQHFEDKKKMTVIGFDSESVIGIKTEEAVEKINSAGFTNVETKPAKDLDIGHLYDEGRVESISIDDNNNFSSSDEFPYDTDVIINYHSIKEVNPPVSSKEAEGMNYKKIVKKLEDAGFVNVKTKAHKDLIIGLLDSDGDVESISIEGDEDYSKSSSYRIDAKVVIKYHTF